MEKINHIDYLTKNYTTVVEILPGKFLVGRSRFLATVYASEHGISAENDRRYYKTTKTYDRAVKKRSTIYGSDLTVIPVKAYRLS